METKNSPAEDVYEFKTTVKEGEKTPEQKTLDNAEVKTDSPESAPISTTQSEESAKRNFSEVGEPGDDGNDEESKRKKRKEEGGKEGKTAAQRCTGKAEKSFLLSSL